MVPCDDTGEPTRSYAPTLSGLPAPGNMPSGSTMADIVDRGFLRAGVSGDSYLLGSRNPFTGVVEGFDIAWTPRLGAALAFHVLLGSIGAWSALAWLMRRGEATGVTSLLYLTPPIAAIVEWIVFGTVPTASTWLGMAIACVGVAMATRPTPAAGSVR